ncbi:hypothetical protein WN51_03976 [Melipona quadrifasciata]|uniref:Uncharacterized protein n=1 Tax=Melipona quadrifasciata TaxID=166423 RepID=A0A0M8ZPJ1_9HYME|nr:hypothetical protein WN51_03976 [Melipona quadrifasciata]
MDPEEIEIIVQLNQRSLDSRGSFLTHQGYLNESVAWTRARAAGPFEKIRGNLNTAARKKDKKRGGKPVNSSGDIDEKNRMVEWTRKVRNATTLAEAWQVLQNQQTRQVDLQRNLLSLQGRLLRLTRKLLLISTSVTSKATSDLSVSHTLSNYNSIEQSPHHASVGHIAFSLCKTDPARNAWMENLQKVVKAKTSRDEFTETFAPSLSHLLANHYAPVTPQTERRGYLTDNERWTGASKRDGGD